MGLPSEAEWMVTLAEKRYTLWWQMQDFPGNPNFFGYTPGQRFPVLLFLASTEVTRPTPNFWSCFKIVHVHLHSTVKSILKQLKTSLNPFL